jgi:hypothetical protein
MKVSRFSSGRSPFTFEMVDWGAAGPGKGKKHLLLEGFETRFLRSSPQPNQHNFFFFDRHYNPSWVSACSTVVEHSQQECFT